MGKATGNDADEQGTGTGPAMVEAELLAEAERERDEAKAALAEASADRDRASDAAAVLQGKADLLAEALRGDGPALEADADVFGMAISALGERDRLTADFTEVSRQRDDLAGKLTAAEKKLAEASKRAPVRQGPKPARLRKVGPLTDQPFLAKAELLALLRTEPHSVVFSDGAQEIDALEPFIVEPEAWQDTPAGVLLTSPLSVSPDRKVRIAGFALLDGGGKQLAWCGLMQPLVVLANQHARLDRQIVF